MIISFGYLKKSVSSQKNQAIMNIGYAKSVPKFYAAAFFFFKMFGR